MNTTAFLGDKPINLTDHGAMRLAGPGIFPHPTYFAAPRTLRAFESQLGPTHDDGACERNGSYWR